MKTPFVGYCRICNQYTELSDDHIPPKGCGNRNRVEIVLNVSGETKISQNGLRTRTICKKCNNERLGAFYDKELIRIYQEILPRYKTKLYLLSSNYMLTINTEYFLKALIGHILSSTFSNETNLLQKLQEPISDDDYQKDFRNYFLGDKRPILKYDIYYWYYPYQTIKIVPFFGYKNNFFDSAENILFCRLIKFFPISVLFVNNEKGKTNLKLRKIEVNNEKQEIILDIKNIVHEHWPEHPTETGAIFAIENGHIQATNINK